MNVIYPIPQYLLIILMVYIFLVPNAQSQQMQIPEIGAFLPSITDVRPKQAYAIDGIWSISAIDKLVRIDRGRIYAIEGWNHLFVLKIKPGMVVIHPFTETDLGIYKGDDLPLQGPLQAILTGDRILDITVQGALGEANYQLIPQQVDDPTAFNDLIKQVRAAGR